jgi:DNA-binding NtrC family response regulator
MSQGSTTQQNITVAKPGPTRVRLLVVSDSVTLSEHLTELLDAYAPEVCPAGSSVLDAVAGLPALRLLLIAEDGKGLAALRLVESVRQQRPEVAILVLSSHPTIQQATEAIRRGAEDFVPVPFSEEVLRKEVDRILEAAELRDRVDALRNLVSTRYGFDDVISQSPRMRSVFDRALAASRSETPVLITGETGTGKELIARAIHANSRRSKHPFVPLNCAALPRDLVESELFGHRRGAFSGALRDHPGIFVGAHGGTLLLDEIGELPLEAQAKLLRVLQDGEVRPIGGLESRRVDVRILAATNQTMAMLGKGGMRQDLFYRLSVLVIEIPPLRERREDVPLLISYFLARHRERGATSIDHLEPSALECLAGHPFAGNVRELENLIEGFVVALPSSRTMITAEDVRSRLGWSAGRQSAPMDDPRIPLKLDDLEAWAIREALQRTHGNKRQAAHLLGISRDTLYRKLRELDSDAFVPGSLT